MHSGRMSETVWVGESDERGVLPGMTSYGQIQLTSPGFSAEINCIALDKSGKVGKYELELVNVMGGKREVAVGVRRGWWRRVGPAHPCGPVCQREARHSLSTRLGLPRLHPPRSPPSGPPLRPGSR
ncbi:hypothetical protein J6590_024133 [Homalodisca vitripennis]|nr:hypothetical protein J6590_024133 [Homalodisca vitripennis]